LGLLVLMVMIIVPVIEIGVFIQAGDLVGLWPTIVMVILTAMIGSALLRHQGLATLIRVRDIINAGGLPVDELFDGLCLLVAGAFLLTPGFITDGFGLLLFLPMFRSGLRRLLAERLKARGKFNMHLHPGSKQQSRRSQSPNIIDGEFYEIKTDNDNKNKNHADHAPLPPPQS
jgi:UPF0716 protein FxsA